MRRGRGGDDLSVYRWGASLSRGYFLGLLQRHRGYHRHHMHCWRKRRTGGNSLHRWRRCCWSLLKTMLCWYKWAIMLKSRLRNANWPCLAILYRILLNRWNGSGGRWRGEKNAKVPSRRCRWCWCSMSLWCSLNMRNHWYWTIRDLLPGG